jgi:hypothetical protein
MHQYHCKEKGMEIQVKQLWTEIVVPLRMGCEFGEYDFYIPHMSLS